jgi:DNA mismatch repair ATPase MutS
MKCVVGKHLHRPSECDNEVVTFLYKLTTGSLPHSYGINVARLAKLPPSVILIAKRISSEFEEKLKYKNQNVKFSRVEKSRTKLNGYFESLSFLSEKHSTPSANSVMDIWNACKQLV